MRAKQTKRIRRVRRHRLALALVGAMAMPVMPALAQSLPSSGSVVNGTASINEAGSTMTITQTTKGAIIDWGSFSIGSGYGVVFDQQFGNTSVTLNRVVGFGYGLSSSYIDGDLTANGSVFLINPAGIAFGSGAVVNVGGLVASTLWMNSGDFINGLATGQYVFNGFNGDTSTHQIRNNATINAGAGGVGFVGPSLINDGAIIANGGNIGFGAGTAVTLDFVGDGLTQVTINAVPTMDTSIGQTRNGSMTADGGRILLRTAATAGGTGGAIAVSGVLRAQTMANVNGRIELTSLGGAVMIGAPGILSDAGTPYTVGTIDVSGQAGESGGSVLIQGNGVWLVNDDPNPGNPTDPGSFGSVINASGETGGQIQIQSSGGVLGLGLSRIFADGENGAGGEVSIAATSDVLLQSDISASSKIGAGGSVAIGSTTGNMFLLTTVNAAGATNGGSIALLAPQGTIGVGAALSASGGGDGGQIIVAAGDILLDEDADLFATGGSGAGGSIAIRANDSLAAFGSLNAGGGTAGGTILTAFGGQFDFRGLVVDAGGGSGAGNWTLDAPDFLQVANGNATGSAGTVLLGNTLQDAEINYALASGTSVVLNTPGGVNFNAAQIASTSPLALSFIVNAGDSITGSGFSITSAGGSLDMVFNADAQGTNTGFAYIDFDGANFASNGGDILMYGRSDPSGGAASSFSTGIRLANSTLDSAGGDVLLRGESTGNDAGGDDAGVVLDGTSITAGAGSVQLFGSGAQGVAGVIASASSIATSGGDVLFDGRSDSGDGIRLDGLGIVTGGGDIGLFGYGGTGVLSDYTDLDSGGGGIDVHGEGDTGNGVDMSALIASAGGAVAISGSSTGAAGVVFGSGYYGAITSGGGDILVQGSGATGGVALYAGSFGGSAIDSAGGDILVTGDATDADAIGVHLYGIALTGGAGDVTVDGSAPLGIGVLFANGAAITTTSGAINLVGEGAGFGLDIADGAIDTDSGDISLTGTALDTDATAGVRVTGGGLATNGGSITVTGNSAGGVGVQLGDGGAFAIDSGGGGIHITGSGVTAGVLMQGNTVDSGGGDIEVSGTASGADGTGVDLSAVSLASGAGDIRVEGTATAGTGVLFANGGAIATTSGAITVIGTGLFGLNASDIPFSTDSGNIHLEGHAQQGTGLSLGVGGLTTNGGDITLVGETASDGQGVQIGGDIASNGGAIRITGTSSSAFDFNHGVLIQGGTGIDSGGGDIDIQGSTAGGVGVWVDGVAIASHGGDVLVDGTSTGTTAYGHGVSLSRGAGIDAGDGDIRIRGSSAGAGVLLFGDVTLASTSGDIAIEGNSSLDGELSSGIRSFDDDGGTTITTTTGSISLNGTATGTDALGVNLGATALSSSSGAIDVTGIASAGQGIGLDDGSGIATASGDIRLVGVGATLGLFVAGGDIATGSGHIDLRGRGTGTDSSGLVIGDGVAIATDGGGIELSGEGGSGAGLTLGDGSRVDAGDSLIVLRAGNDGSSDAIRLGGTLSSTLGVNLRPGGVDANGGLTERLDDEILLGGDAGFALSGAELASIDAPQLVIGSDLHAGAIRVLSAVGRDGNLTLQNDGGSGGIDLQAALDVGDGILALSSGGDIVQTADGAITAHSLLARAGGDILLANAANNVAANTLAGSAGGDFEYLDVDELAIGSVSALGMDAGSNGMSGIGATGISAGGDVFVRNLDGDLTLNADVSGTNIDLVTAGRLQNPAGASLVASGDWRVWADTWEGETRGGLAGSGDLPNLYGCIFLGACGVTVPGTDNHFIYVQQPTALVSFDDFSREYGLPNPVFTFTVSGAILGDSAANVATGAGITAATILSDVGSYAITGDFTSAAGYRIEFAPGTLLITPATLLFTADPFVRYLGTANPLFTGTVTGFRNDDTVQSVFGSDAIWSSPAGPLSPIGFYPIVGGTSARNYVFAQAPGNATALQIIPLPQLSSTPIDLIRETVDTYVYDRNFGSAPICAINASLDDQQLASYGDDLSKEWSKVRSRPNLTNCFDSETSNACGDF